MTSPRIGLVGAGLIGRKHLELVLRHALLDAVIDPDPAAEDLAGTAAARWFSDLDGYLAASRPDGLIVASPNGLHVAHGSAALNAGIPVLIEKPLADTLPGAAALADLSDATGVPVLVGHHRRHSTIARAAKAAIDGGRLGRIATVNAQFWLYKPDDYFDATWRTRAGGGPIFINLIHDIDLLRHFCGEIRQVQAVTRNALRGFEVEDTAAVLLEFEGGALGTVSISDSVAAPWSWELTAGENPAYPRTPMACYTIGGTDGSLSIPDLRLWHHPGEKSWWAPIKDTRLPVEERDPVEAQFLHFLDVIAGRAGPLVPAREGARTLAVLEAIREAAKTGSACPVAI